MLGRSVTGLTEAYDLAMLDLDGVVYVGDAAVAGAARHLGAVRAAGMHVAFITNNAARPPAQVAAHLARLGVEAAPADVVTSAQAASRILAERFERGSRVYLLGGPGLDEALREEGLVPVDAVDGAVAVASGYGPDLPWRRVMAGAVAIRSGLPWVAANNDWTIPTELGTAPGHGVMVRMLSGFTGVEPEVAGKPHQTLLDETVRRVGGSRPLMVGDRLDTDIEGAHNAGVDSLLVLTGVTTLVELAAAAPGHRPTYLAPDLAGLLEPHPVPASTRSGWELGGWSASTEGGLLTLSGTGSAGDWWRVAAVAAWSYLDTEGRAVDVSTARHRVPTATGGAG